MGDNNQPVWNRWRFFYREDKNDFNIWMKSNPLRNFKVCEIIDTGHYYFEMNRLIGGKWARACLQLHRQDNGLCSQQWRKYIADQLRGMRRYLTRIKDSQK